MRQYIPVLILALMLFSCDQLNEKEKGEIKITISEIPHSGDQTGEPNLHTSPNGDVYLSWIGQLNDSTHTLNYSSLDKNSWSEARTIATGSNWFVNWADFPALSLFGNDDLNMAAHWLQKRTPGTYYYDVHISISNDGGQSWSKSFLPHTDGVAAEHGFVSLLPVDDNKILATWLDGRYTKSQSDETHGKGDAHGHGHGGPMTLRTASFDSSGKLSDEFELDNRVCDCCQTGAAMTDIGPVIVYRDRSKEEVRDISIVRLVNGKWTDPKSIHHDNWMIEGCPVNGPSISALNNNVVVAWFTMKGEKGVVKVSFSDDAGASFSGPIIVDDASPIGRVDLVLLSPNRAVISWLTSEGNLMCTIANPSGLELKGTKIAQSSSSRKSGFPVITKNEERVVIAWSDADKAPLIKTAFINIEQ